MARSEAFYEAPNILTRNPASFTGLLVTALVHVAVPPAGAVEPVVMIDPEISVRVEAGRTRVLVELRVDDTSDAMQRGEGIARVQEAVLSRLPQSHASLSRRYTSVPILALEIDATALRALQAMTDEVIAIKPDRLERPQ
jgi:hypothetical protein